jgi:hypothetical protein
MADEKTAVKFEVPEAPDFPGFTASMRATWRQTWRRAFIQAQNDFPDDAPAQTQAANREANRPLTIEPPRNYKEAMELEPRQFVKREIAENGQLKVVTIDGKKLFYDVPKSAKNGDGDPGGAKT